MSQIREALSAFNKVSKLQEESPVLQQAREVYSQNPEDEGARNRFSQLSIPAGYPDVHKAAVNFQNALMSTAKAGHMRGWQGGENEQADLMQAAQTHGVDPGLFVSPEGAGNTKREHVLHLTRLFGGKFLPGDGRSNMWDPIAHSFPDEQSVQGFSNSMQQYYPESQLQPQPVPMQGEEQGEDGRPIPTQQMVYNVPFSHEDLGEPFPPGTNAYAMATAQQRSAAAPHPHFVVVDPQTGEHSVTLEPDPQTQQIVQTFVDGQPVQMQPPGAEEEQPEEQPPEEQPDQQQQPQEQPQQQPAMARAAESIDPLEGFLAESGFTVGSKLLHEHEEAKWKTAHDVLEAHKEKTFKSSKERKGRQPWWKHESLAGLFDNPKRELKDKNVRDLRRLAGVQTNDVEYDMDDGLNEMLNLFRNSTRKTPSLQMENLPVDSNRGVTSRGNSHFDKFASPATREKVLKSRMDEIEAFARSRSIPMSNMYAATEASMRTGKVPNMTQYGLNGDDAVAAKQFIISNIMNIQGLEDVNPDGDELSEAGLSWERDADRPELTRQGAQAGAEFHKQLQKDPSREVRVQQDIQRRQARESAQKQATRPAAFVAHDKALARHKSIQQLTHRKRPVPQSPEGYQAQSTNYDGESLEETHGTSGKHPAVAGTIGNPPQVSPGQRFMKGGLPKKAHKGKFYVEEVSKKVLDEIGNEFIFQGSATPEEMARGMKRAKEIARKNDARKAEAAKSKKWLTGRWRPDGPDRPDNGSGGALVKPKGSRGPWGPKKPTQPAMARQMKDDVGINPFRYMSEERPMRKAGTPTSDGQEQNPGLGAPIDISRWEKRALLPKKIMSQLRKEIGDRVDGYPQEELYRLAREHGLLGTEESAYHNDLLNISEGDPRGDVWPKLDPELARLLNIPINTKSLAGADIKEHDYTCAAKSHKGKFLGYVQPHQAMYEFPTESAAHEFASKMSGKTTATPTVNGKRVSIDEPMLGENAAHLGAGGTSTTRGSNSPHHGGIGPSTPPLLKKKRSETDRILGIDEGDPREESWPKLGDEMQKLLNLEDMRSLAPKPGFYMPEPEADISEATTGGASVGAFIGAGMKGFNLTQRTTPRPSYDDSEVLDGDEENNRKAWDRMMQKHGIRQEGFYGETEADKARKKRISQRLQPASAQPAQREPAPRTPAGIQRQASLPRRPAAKQAVPKLTPGQPLERRVPANIARTMVKPAPLDPKDSRGIYGAKFMKKPSNG